MILEGTVLQGPDFEPIEGRVVAEGGEIVAVEETGDFDGTLDDRLVLPAFVNAHTHIGDSIAKEAGAGLTLEELVAPPDGLKHRLLRSASRDELVAAMGRSIDFMEAAGTAAFVEFREGGVDGVTAIERALEGTAIEAVVLGRESVAAMAASDGFGASGANDADFEVERRATADAGKLFAIHAGEADSSDLDAAMALDPDVLVHVVHPEPRHLDQLAEGGPPVVCCPRSNLATNVGVPPIAVLADRTTVALGTDNVMLSSPSMFREMATAEALADVSAREVLAMATVNGAEIAGLDCGLIAEGRTARLLVLDGDSDNLAGALDPVRAVVRRASVADVERVVYPADT